MFKQIKVISVLISLVALGCTDAKPDFAVLSSSFSGPTFSGNGSLTLNINSGSDSVSIAGECDTKILSLQWSFNGTTFVTVDPDDINSGSDLSCADGNFNLQIDDISTLLPGMVPGNTRNIYVRGVNEFGPTAAGTITITYSSGPTVPDATTSSIDILTTSVQVSTGTLQASVKVILRTSDSLPVTGVTPTLSGYGTINETLPTCSASDPAGESICTFSSTQASAREIELATPVMVTTVGDIVTFTPGPANASVFHLEPGDTKSGQLFTQQPVIRVNDSFGNLVTGYSGTITLDTVPTGKLLGTVSRNAVSGVATFTD